MQVPRRCKGQAPLASPGVQLSSGPCFTPWCLSCLVAFSHVQLCVTSWTVAHQAPLSMGFPRQEYWSGLPFPPPGDLPHPQTEPKSPALQADSFAVSCQGSPKLLILAELRSV